jgi:hypothetical protein
MGSAKPSLGTARSPALLILECPGSKSNPVGQDREPQGEMEGEEDPNMQRPGGKNETNVRP